MKTMLKRAIKFFAVPVFSGLAWVSRRFAYLAHGGLMRAVWLVDTPEYFDHDCDLYYQWEKAGRAYWVERGVYDILALQVFEEPVAIELCCGEGFNTKYFYSYHVKNILACDFCEDAIRAARKKYAKENIQFEVLDIRNQIPEYVRGGAADERHLGCRYRAFHAGGNRWHHETGS